VTGGRSVGKMANSMTTSAREVVLASIRTATGGSTHEAAVHAEWSGIPRAYTQHATHDREGILELLTDRLKDYDAQVLHVSSDGIQQGIATMLAARGVKRLVIPAGLSQAWLPEGYAFVEDGGLSYDELNAVEGILTGATLAIAETGTIVLQNTAGQGRRAATLVPDYHLCIVDMANVVETVPEAMAKLAVTAELATTFISGPSATADIEMTRIKGVHGPRFLDVIVVA
jgi:L-lactate dehydrogenase complex protein LldG